MKVVFLHPDLGIGGAERLVLDAALALKKKEHDVHIVTNQFSEDHCFEEAKEFKESGKLEVVAKNVPRTIFGKCYALCAYIRLCIAAAYIYWYHSDADVIFCDQISAPLPIFRMLPIPTKGTKASLLFYCHYPDQLLTSRNTFWKTVYRLAIDYIESCTMNCADRILVNSHFTERVVLKTFPALSDHSLTVLHPSINCGFFDQTSERLAEQNGNGTNVILEELGTELFDLIEHDDTTIFLSINRFERKKNIELAIHAFEHLIHKTFAPEDADRCFLVIAGGYDPLNTENIDYYEELQAKSVGLGGKQIRFVKSPSDETKIWLMEMANLVVYTPDREHFGIVPIEAMYLSTPVLAVNSGGPLETVEHEKTGFLRPADPQVFAQAMAVAVDEPDLLQDMGVAGRQRVEDHFSFDAFADKLDNIVRDMRNNREGSDRVGEDQQQPNKATEEE